MIAYRCNITRTNYLNYTRNILRKNALFIDLNGLKSYYEAVIKKDLDNVSVLYFDGLRRFHSEGFIYRDNILPDSWEVLCKRFSDRFLIPNQIAIYYEPKFNKFYPYSTNLSFNDYVYEIKIEILS